MKKWLLVAFLLATPSRAQVPIYPFVNESGRWGFIDTLGQVVVRPEYDTIGFRFSSSGLEFDVWKSGIQQRWNHLGTRRDTVKSRNPGQNKIIFPWLESMTTWDSLLVRHGAQLNTLWNTKYGWGLIDTSGSRLIAPRFGNLPSQPLDSKWRAKPLVIGRTLRNRVRFLGHGLPNFREHGSSCGNCLWGFADSTGSVVVPPTFHWVGEFTDERTWFSDDCHQTGWDCLQGSWGIIDRWGKVVVAPTLRATYVGDFVDGSAVVMEGGSYDNGPYGGRFSLVSSEGKIVRADIGEIRLNFLSDELLPLDDGSVLNRKGQWVIGPGSGMTGWGMSEGYLVMSDSTSRYMYLDQSGKPLTDSLYDEARRFHMGWGFIRKADRWGAINLQGKNIVPLEWDEVTLVDEHIVRVRSKQGWGYYHRSGKKIWSSP